MCDRGESDGGWKGGGGAEEMEMGGGRWRGAVKRVGWKMEGVVWDRKGRNGSGRYGEMKS